MVCKAGHHLRLKGGGAQDDIQWPFGLRLY